jgi:AcrR family transcriptional regulator
MPPKVRRSREVGARFEEIVDAAAMLFSEQGYAATSIQDIADRVGILKGSLYHYIHTKEDLLEAVIREAHLHTAALGVNALEMEGDALAKLSYVVERHLMEATGKQAKVRVFYQEAKFLPPERLAGILATRDSYEHSIRQIIVAGQAEGTIAPHLDPVLTAIAILSVLNSVQQWFRPDGPRSLAEVTESFTDLMIRGVSACPPPPPPSPSTLRPPRSARRPGRAANR